MTKAPSDAKKSGSTARKILWLGAVVLLAVVAWTGAWHYAAAHLRDRLPAALAIAEANGVRADCRNADIRGFPFRMGLFCDGTAIDIPRDGISASAGGLRSAAQIYAPGHVVSEIDGPLVIDGKRGLSAHVDWQLMHASTVVGTGGLDRASLEGRQLNLDLDAPGLPVRIAADIRDLEAHFRQNGQDLDIVVEVAHLLSPLLPAMNALVLEATVPGGAPLADYRTPSRSLVGRDVVVHSLTAELQGGGTLVLTGRLEIARDGLLSGDFRLRISDPSAVVAAAGPLVPPEEADRLAGMVPILTALDTEPGDDSVTLPLTLRKGRASIGLLPLGTIPPIGQAKT